MENRYTEGIAFDGAAILDNGKPITIDEILKRLNEHNELVNKTNDIHDVSNPLHDHVVKFRLEELEMKYDYLMEQFNKVNNC